MRRRNDTALHYGMAIVDTAGVGHERADRCRRRPRRPRGLPAGSRRCARVVEGRGPAGARRPRDAGDGPLAHPAHRRPPLPRQAAPLSLAGGPRLGTRRHRVVAAPVVGGGGRGHGGGDLPHRDSPGGPEHGAGGGCGPGFQQHLPAVGAHGTDGIAPGALDDARVLEPDRLARERAAGGRAAARPVGGAGDAHQGPHRPPAGGGHGGGHGRHPRVVSPAPRRPRAGAGGGRGVAAGLDRGGRHATWLRSLRRRRGGHLRP